MRRVEPIHIRKSVMVLGMLSLFFGSTNLSGQDTGGTSTVAAPQSSLANTPQGVEILSDTRGVDFKPYVKEVLRMIRQKWIPLIPEEARPPRNMPGETLIRFSINADGKIGEMHLDGSTHQVKIDRAAWGAITAVGQFPPLPKEFTGPNLELRILFRVNSPATTHP